ncbi:hypothetical protein BDZ94DRAFT_440025 [Collybia nuda]|uniref:Uncharacterized protein n=1 Tax=Collybia nuda TaxID=64659 RepID=A0A9P6CBK4_9AGAR|nr:hypothetical protein BDZ94DRAFT_440025 [Collybia nuda]
MARVRIILSTPPTALMESRELCVSGLQPRDFIFFILPPVIQGVLYGVYFMLFCLSMHIFRKRQSNKGHRGILIGNVVLFVCCTLQCAFGSFPVTGLQSGTTEEILVPVTNNALYVFTNLVANSLFAFRCYVIWGRKKYILWLPSLLILAETGFGSYWCISSMPLGESSDIGIDGLDTRTPLIFTLATNVALTGLSAGRIWWISRKLRILGPKVTRKYNTIIALIVESGLIYCIAIAAYLISIPNNIGFDGFGVTTSEIVVKTFFVILTQVVGIVPTLMVVRIGLGVSTEDAQTILTSQIRFDQGEDGARRIITQQPAMATSTPYIIEG